MFGDLFGANQKRRMAEQIEAARQRDLVAQQMMQAMNQPPQMPARQLVATAMGGTLFGGIGAIDPWHVPYLADSVRPPANQPKPEPVPLSGLIENLEKSGQDRIELFL